MMLDYSLLVRDSHSAMQSLHIDSPALLIKPRFKHSGYVDGVAMMHPPPNTIALRDPRSLGTVIYTDGIEVGRLNKVNQIARGGWVVSWPCSASITELDLSEMPANLIRMLVSGVPEVQEQAIEVARSLYSSATKIHAARWLISRVQSNPNPNSKLYGQLCYLPPAVMRQHGSQWIETEKRIVLRFVGYADA